MFTDIKLFAYIRPVQCNVKIVNGSKVPVKGFGLFTITPPPPKHDYTPLVIILYATGPKQQNQSNYTQISK